MQMSVEIKNAVKNYYDIFLAIGTIYEKLAKAHGLTSSSLFVLHIIYEQPDECTQSLICEKLLYPKQTVNAILNAFEKNGVIIRETSGSDRRAKNIRLTEAGQAYAAPILSDMFDLEEGTFAAMDHTMLRAMIDGEQAFLAQLTREWHAMEPKFRKPERPGKSV